MNRAERRRAKRAGGQEPHPLHKLTASMAEGERRTVREILGEGRTVEKITEVGANVLGWTTHEMDHVSTLKDGPALQCRDGCPWCCYLRVDVNAPEVLTLAAYLRATRSPEELETLRTHARAVGERVKPLSSYRWFVDRGKEA